MSDPFREPVSLSDVDAEWPQQYAEAAARIAEVLAVLGPTGPPVNVQVFAAQSPLLADNRIIRDYLRAHPDAAYEYVRSKDKALEQGQTDLRSYSRAKSESIAAVREAASRWARGTRH